MTEGNLKLPGASPEKGLCIQMIPVRTCRVFCREPNLVLKAHVYAGQPFNQRNSGGYEIHLVLLVAAEVVHVYLPPCKISFSHLQKFTASAR